MKEAFQGAPRGSLLDVLPSSVRRLVAVGGSVSLSLLLAACAAEARANGNDHVPISEPVPATSTIDTTPSTEVPPQPVIVQNSPTPEVTPTVNVDALPVSEVARMVAEGKVSYQELQHWNNEQRREFGIAMAEYVNTEVAGDKAYVDMHFPEIGDTKIAWSPDYGWWRSSHNTPESQLDLTGETLPPMFVAGYTNTEGQEVFINAQGQEVVVPKINMPGELGEVSVTELYSMGLRELNNYAISIQLGANGMSEYAKGVIEGRRNTHFALPVVMYENADQNEKIYSYQITGRQSSRMQIPESDVIFLNWRTNNVLIPVLEPTSKQLIGWVSIQQGLRFVGMESLPFAPGENPQVFSSAESADPNTFGYDAEDYFALVMMGKTMTDVYGTGNVTYFLERSNYIGSTTEIQRLMGAKSVPETMKILSGLRMFVSYPRLYIYPTQ